MPARLHRAVAAGQVSSLEIQAVARAIVLAVLQFTASNYLASNGYVVMQSWDCNHYVICALLLQVMVIKIGRLTRI